MPCKLESFEVAEEMVTWVKSHWHVPNPVTTESRIKEDLGGPDANRLIEFCNGVHQSIKAKGCTWPDSVLGEVQTAFQSVAAGQTINDLADKVTSKLQAVDKSLDRVTGLESERSNIGMMAVAGAIALVGMAGFVVMKRRR